LGRSSTSILGSSFRAACTRGGGCGACLRAIRSRNSSGVSTTSKISMRLEFTKDGFRLLNEAITNGRDSQQEPGLQLEAIAQAYWKFAFDHKEYYQLMFGLGIPACETVNQVAEMKEFSDTLISVIQQAINASKEPQVNAFLKFHTYWSILHGLVSIQMIDRKTSPWSQLVLKDAIDGFIKALNG
ncbi:MAG: WHG domain-containing protein, partial [Cytophagaceae bacterium]